jgi:hypothetical protein
MPNERSVGNAGSCYQPPAMRNVADFHRVFAKNESQVLLVEDQPFPHTLPGNGTVYFNNNSNATGAGYDGPGECVKHVIGKGTRLYPAPPGAAAPYWKRVNVSEFVEPGDAQQGMTSTGR